MSRVQVVKLNERFAQAVDGGLKTFEIRLDDRDYRVGDALVFTAPDGKPYGMPPYEVTYKLTHEDFPAGLREGYCALAIERQPGEDPRPFFGALERKFGYRRSGSPSGAVEFLEKRGDNGERIAVGFWNDGTVTVSGFYGLFSPGELEAISMAARAVAERAKGGKR